MLGSVETTANDLNERVARILVVIRSVLFIFLFLWIPLSGFIKISNWGAFTPVREIIAPLVNYISTDNLSFIIFGILFAVTLIQKTKFPTQKEKAAKQEITTLTAALDELKAAGQGSSEAAKIIQKRLAQLRDHSSS